MYTQESIDRVRDCSILTVVQNYIDLKQSGSNYKACSPFVDEKTPSFIVSPAKNIFKCFSSGKGGDAISFVQEFETCDFVKAIETIAEIDNIFLEREELSEEQQRKYEHNEELKALNGAVANKYVKELKGLDDTHWVTEHLKSRGYNEDVCLEFQLGFASGQNLISQGIVQNAKLELGKELGLVKVKNGKSYDFFRERIIFPIMNRNGQVIGFGGRKSNAEDQKSYAKYLNSQDSVIYKKDVTLYGLHLAISEIRKYNTAILVEGYTDVISMHIKEARNTIATCGTALTENHASILCRLCNHVVVFRDGDASGIRAAHRDIDMLLRVGVRVSVIISEKGEDPGSISEGQVDMSVYVEDYAEDAVLWKAKTFLVEAGDNPSAKAMALNKVVETLCRIDNTIVRDEYVKEIAKIYQHTVRVINTEIKKYLSAVQEQRMLQIKKKGGTQLDGLPEGADPNEFLERGFCTIDNAYWMKTKNGWNPVTNFKMTPLFHIKGGLDTPRLFEVVNTKGKKAIIELPSTGVLNLTTTQSLLLDYGVFTFDININQIQFKTIMVRLIEECIEAKQFVYFGWQNKGFWAFANGVFYNDEFYEVNKYGIVVLEGLEKVDSEYYDNTPNFYSPAFNETNKFNDEGNDYYENDRTFVYKKSPIDLETWMSQMVKVYGNFRGALAISYCFATIFRDLFQDKKEFFPHLYLYGEKGSGKSKYGDSIHKFFTYKLAPFDLNSGTQVGFYRRIARLKNVVVFFEEMNDKIDDKIFQPIKGAYDNRGRERGKLGDDNRTLISKVNSSMVIAGQYLTTRDDNAIISRSILQSVLKQNYTNEEKAEYSRLKTWEQEGISSLVLDVVKHRKIVEQNLSDVFDKNSKMFANQLNNLGYHYEERMSNNYNAMYSIIELLYKLYKFPFTLEEFYTDCLNGIIDNSDLLVETEGVSEFWNTLEKLFEKSIVRSGLHFNVNQPVEDTLQPKKGEKVKWKNTERKNVLYLRLNSVHQDYVKEVSTRDGVDVIGEATLRNYFKSKKYYIGFKSGHRFPLKGSTSCYLFDYDFLRENGILNLDPPETGPPPVMPTNGESSPQQTSNLKNLFNNGKK